MLLLDEPFGSLDARTRRELRNDVREILNHQNTASILVTHDPEEAMEMGDKIVYLQEGRIVQSGTAATFYDAPLTAEVARTFSMANVIDGVIEGDRVQSAFGDWPLDCLRNASAPAGVARLAVRPEDLIVTRQESTAKGAVVVDRRRAGPDIVLSGRTDSGQRWVTRLNGSNGPQIGEAVSLAPVRGSVMAFPPDFNSVQSSQAAR
ncbi:MAG: TOBE domain-containing protein [Burkholderiales bacterium]|nr:MAG: TOBE domain-containing protein [Burkholderiales bacterium]